MKGIILIGVMACREDESGSDVKKKGETSVVLFPLPVSYHEPSFTFVSGSFSSVLNN